MVSGLYADSFSNQQNCFGTFRVADGHLNTLALLFQGNIGVMDVSTRSYTTVMRSHTDVINCMTLDATRRHLATVSDDHSIRVWDFDTMQQVCVLAQSNVHADAQFIPPYQILTFCDNKLNKCRSIMLFPNHIGVHPKRTSVVPLFKSK